jgi:hypothetical protein
MLRFERQDDNTTHNNKPERNNARWKPKTTPFEERSQKRLVRKASLAAICPPVHAHLRNSIFVMTGNSGGKDRCQPSAGIVPSISLF